MNFPSTQAKNESHSLPAPHGEICNAPENAHLNDVLQALTIPFDLAVVQWRVTEYSDDGTRGLMLPYADPRAYSDRLNGVFTPAGWSRRYTVQASAPVQRSKRGPAAKILVTCEVTIALIGTNSGTGEEWLDRENALTAAEAQAFKRSLSCFGLGRYLYDIDGEWVELDHNHLPTKIPRLPRWATPNGWLAGLRPKPRRNRRAFIRVNGHSGHGESQNGGPNANRESLIATIEGMENKIGRRLYRGLLKRVARVWNPGQIQEAAVLEKVLAQMQGAMRGQARLEAAQSRLTPETVQQVISSLNTPPAKLEDLQTLHTLVVALEKEVEAQTRGIGIRIYGDPPHANGGPAALACEPDEERNFQVSRIAELATKLRYNRAKTQMLLGQYVGNLNRLEQKLADAVGKAEPINGEASLKAAPTEPVAPVTKPNRGSKLPSKGLSA